MRLYLSRFNNGLLVQYCVFIYLVCISIESLFLNYIPEHGIDFETLLMLTEDNVKELVPMIGHRAKLIKQLSTVEIMLTDACDVSKIFFLACAS